MIINLNPKNPIESGLCFLVSKGFTFQEAEECRKAIQKFDSKKCDEFYKRIDHVDWMKVVDCCLFGREQLWGS